MSYNHFEKGAAAAVLHFLFGAIVGAIIFGFIAWQFFGQPFLLHVTAAGAAFAGAAAAIWRGRFWTALGRNSLFKLWRVLTGSRQTTAFGRKMALFFTDTETFQLVWPR